MRKTSMIAIDLGASSGRVMQANFDGSQLQLHEIHRFPNDPVRVGSTLCWDILRLWHEIRTSLDALPAQTASIGIDTWANDFGLLDRDGTLLSNPVHYRDERTSDMPEWVFQRVPKREVYERTGIQFMPQNTVLQFASLVARRSPLLEVAHTYLMIPDLLNFWLTGEKVVEFTNATTTQFLDPRTQRWDSDLLERLGIPTAIFPPVIQSGERVGTFQNIPVIAPATHDTGSAVVAVPMEATSAAYISSGTWSLLGLELDHPLITDDTYAANITNEGGAYGTWRFLKNVMGLWLIQQCQATWQRYGDHFDFEQLDRMASRAEPFFALINPDDPVFFAPGDMPRRVQEYCQQTGQARPETREQIVRIIYESLALKYRYVLERLILLSGCVVECLHIVGGGAQNALLCQMTANAIGREVIAGPIEATALGNAIVQLIALGELDNITQAREMLKNSVATTVYQPSGIVSWDEVYPDYCHLIADGHMRRQFGPR